ncbi:hypothetical protein AL036_17210 [Salipiger aestuarii]|uniref:Uncharacterized protein (DUF427 family) n=1 Tax=Salipiger aestuarii TaxID=568098 RepID=A0A327XRD9_9RHOB|nr:DUF427 domain-containing protein [Salipiger aestuarii]EIE52449.1 hypothetical protein C357_03695 [Citreicella sp. 357]KAA8605808.1 hypothetical protein AL036_17210 [Salipiger aestuarii]KAA8608505.1 hypothetical protein AL037_17005 [Salipiger aestuarii]KAB2540597.1 hypothetical protein AL035_16880 [Salipiger aestuarii]RAK11293.1 uncharacterized protein (DUF427 family) [Salipiger aestuarii]
MLKHITIRPATGTWVIRAGGAVLGESSRALELTEGDMPFVVYFPREDIATAFLEPSAYRTQNPWLGEAAHYTIVSKSRSYENAVWSYETPKEDGADLAGYLAFHVQDGIAVEQI